LLKEHIVKMDREKVIRHIVAEISIAKTCKKDFALVDIDMLSDALSMLKEREAVKPVRDKEIGRIWLCGKCGSYVGFEDNYPGDPNEFDKYCRECGRPVLWEGR
jgi:hypothetical protein